MVATVNDAILSFGSMFAGITFVLTSQVLYKFGLQFDLFHDQKRQTMLNFLCFLASLNAMAAYPLNQSLVSVLGSNVTTLFTFTFVQFGLVVFCADHR
jgi:hypothetical protein